jgi:hypothetical protein
LSGRRPPTSPATKNMARFRRSSLNLRLFFRLLAVAFLFASPGLGTPAKRPVLSVPLCPNVSLSAGYLSATGPKNVPGFQFLLKNNTAREIRLAEPFPSSSHWYALTQGKWLWRASNGAGGSLLDAANEHGRLVVYKSPPASVPEMSFTVKPHQARQWIESELENPVLAYKPGCPICSYPGEREYRVVFAYAYLPEDRQSEDGFLACGIRSKPVPMPPKVDLL